MKNAKLISYLKIDKKVDKKLIPTIEQIKNYRYYYQKNKINEICSKTRSVYELWINGHKFNESNFQELFVLDHSINKDNFIFIFSSILLLQQIDTHQKLGYTQNLSIDATYKLISCKFPLVIMGIEDSSRYFHPICFAIVSTENINKYIFILSTVKNFMKDKYNFIWRPTVYYI